MPRAASEAEQFAWRHGSNWAAINAWLAG